MIKQYLKIAPILIMLGVAVAGLAAFMHGAADQTEVAGHPSPGAPRTRPADGHAATR